MSLTPEQLNHLGRRLLTERAQARELFDRIVGDRSDSYRASSRRSTRRSIRCTPHPIGSGAARTATARFHSHDWT